MRAIKSDRREKFTISHRKENSGLFHAYKVIDRNFNTIVDCRVYWPGQTAYCCIWIAERRKGENCVNRYFSGSGKAGGCGYHKESSAVGDAIYNAGYDLDKRIDGVGDNAILEALEAVARCAVGGNRKLHIVKCHA